MCLICKTSQHYLSRNKITDCFWNSFRQLSTFFFWYSFALLIRNLLTNLSGNLSADLLWNLLRDSATNLPVDRSALLNLDLLTDVVGDNPALSLRNLDLNQVTIRLRNKGTLFLDNLLGNFTLQGSGNVFTLLPGDVATDLLMNFLL